MVEPLEPAGRNAGQVGAVCGVCGEDRRAEPARRELALDDDAASVRRELNRVVLGLAGDRVGDLVQPRTVRVELPDGDQDSTGAGVGRHREGNPPAVGRPGRRLDRGRRRGEGVGIRAVRVYHVELVGPAVVAARRRAGEGDLVAVGRPVAHGVDDVAGGKRDLGLVGAVRVDDEQRTARLVRINEASEGDRTVLARRRGRRRRRQDREQEGDAGKAGEHALRGHGCHQVLLSSVPRGERTAGHAADPGSGREALVGHEGKLTPDDHDAR